MSTLQILKQKHLDSIAKFNPIRIKPDQFKIVRNNVEVIITLDSKYPETIPIITSNIMHEWMMNGFIQNDRIRNWNIHSSLGVLVDEILVEFAKLQPLQPQLELQHQYQTTIPEQFQLQPTPSQLKYQELT